VTGFNLHTNKTFYGGLASASGISPNISRVTACFLAFCSLVAF